MRYKISYGQKEIAIIEQCIAKSPTNLKAAFEYAAETIGGVKPASISAYYYANMRGGNNKLIVTGSKNVMAINVKNSPRFSEKICVADIVRQYLAKLNKAERLEIVSILFE